MCRRYRSGASALLRGRPAPDARRIAAAVRNTKYTPLAKPAGCATEYGRASLKETQMKSGRLVVLTVSLLTATASAASAAPATASGPAALALAGVVALYSPLLTADEREAVSAFFVGQSGVRYARKISVTADKIVCRDQQCRHHRALLRTDVQGRQADHRRTARQRNLCNRSHGRHSRRRRRRIGIRKPLEAELHARSGRDQAEGRRRGDVFVRNGELSERKLAHALRRAAASLLSLWEKGRNRAIDR